jgi:hypothetical protein
LQDCGEAPIQIQGLLYDSYKHLNDECNNDISFKIIFSNSIKGLKMQVRLDPLGEQLPSQSATIQSGCGYGRERKFVGQDARYFWGPR